MKILAVKILRHAFVPFVLALFFLVLAVWTVCHALYSFLQPSLLLAGCLFGIALIYLFLVIDSIRSEYTNGAVGLVCVILLMPIGLAMGTLGSIWQLTSTYQPTSNPAHYQRFLKLAEYPSNASFAHFPEQIPDGAKNIHFFGQLDDASTSHQALLRIELDGEAFLYYETGLDTNGCRRILSSIQSGGSMRMRAARSL